MKNWRRLMDALMEFLPSPPSRWARGNPGEWPHTCVSAGALCGGSTVDGVMGWPARGLGLGSIRGTGSGGCGGGGADGVSELPRAGGGDEGGSPGRGSGGDGKPDGDLGGVEPVCASAGAAASMTAARASATFRAHLTVDLLVISAPPVGAAGGSACC